MKSNIGPNPGMLCRDAVNVTPVVNNTAHEVVTYTTIHRDACVDHLGVVTSREIQIIPRDCRGGFTLKSFLASIWNVFTWRSYHDEIMTISQYHGSEYFHATIESLTRLAPYLDFLKQNPRIKVHVTWDHPFLRLLNISSDRVVTGKVKAGVVYMPAGTHCGVVPHPTASMLSQALQKSLPEQSPSRDIIILIKRSRRRWFDHHADILSMMRRRAQPHGFRVVEFRDDTLPSLEQTIDMFQRALIIVAPHGAGESNIVLSQPGSVLIEGLCYHKGYINLCYQHTAQMLGLRYYGLVFDRSCHGITADDIEKPFVQYLEMFGYH